MVHDPELKAAGDVIFEPNKHENKKRSVFYCDEESKRRLKTSWEFIVDSEKNNKGRVSLKRYLALMANKELRKKVLGF